MAEPETAGPSKRIPRQRGPTSYVRAKPAQTKEDTRKKAKTTTDAAIEAAAERLAAEAPPLSAEQRARLAELFAVVVNRYSG
ncbi:hypothetical protein HDA40_006959 [Hamadaea flava]|uniref:Uncharacterized protein n=1 Tax=Hamadaea flava TaxID=1742688 RepID=A0ABV8M0N1_9ACTN|nr:hypothetical protein [Hamadaea flava]MCP2328452.1 hypothetical protein [Hamadaea flava]